MQSIYQLPWFPNEMQNLLSSEKSTFLKFLYIASDVVCCSGVA